VQAAEVTDLEHQELDLVKGALIPEIPRAQESG